MASVTRCVGMPDEPAWGQFRRLARENGIHSVAALKKLGACGALWPERPGLTWRQQMLRLMAGKTDRSGLLAYFQAHCLYPQLLPGSYWLPRWPSLINRWDTHHATLFPSPLVIRSCRDCALEDVKEFGFSWFRQGHQLPGVEWCSRHSGALHQLPTKLELWHGGALTQFQPPMTLAPSIPMPSFVQRYLRVLDWLRAPPNRGGWGEMDTVLTGVLDGCVPIERHEDEVLRKVRAAAPDHWYRTHFIEARAHRVQWPLKYPQAAQSAWLALSAAALTQSNDDVNELLRSATRAAVPSDVLK